MDITFDKILIVGTGLDLSIALEIVSRDLQGKVFYCSRVNESFPRIENVLVGKGFERFGLSLVDDVDTFIEFEDKNLFVVVTDVGFGGLVDRLRERNFIVFGSTYKGDMLENNRVFGKKVMQESEISVPEYYSCESLREVEKVLGSLSEDEKWVLKANTVSGSFDTRVGTVVELLGALEQVEEVEKGLEVGYILEKYIEGIEVASAAFFNGKEFLKPIVITFESEWGGYISWERDSEVFEKGLSRVSKVLGDFGYRGMIDLNGIWTRNGEYYGIEFASRFGYPWGRIQSKMISNLVDVLFATANGDLIDISLFKTSAYFVNGFRNLEFEEEDGFVDLGKIYQIEQMNPDKYGITFDKVVMDDRGIVYVLPGYSRLFQMIGFGDSYFDAVDYCWDMFDICKRRIDFKENRQELVEDIRDRIVFFESWSKEKNNLSASLIY